MEIRYLDPLRRSWERARDMLFHGASLEMWFVLGFTAWLSHLWDNAGFGGTSWKRQLFRISFDDLHLPHLRHALDFRQLGTGSFELAAIALLLVAGFALALLLTWLGSRGEFCFLDNVVHRRARFTDPWRRYARLGDSLFVWRIGFQIIGGALAIALLLPGALLVLGMASIEAFRVPGTAAAIALAFFGVVIGLAATLINFWTTQFVVPVMYRAEIGVLDAWRRTLPWLRAHAGHAIGFALYWLLLTIVVVACVAVLGLLTCCVGLVVLAIPYLGTVLLLPIYVTGRALAPEFLAQFGEEWRLWPPAGPAPGETDDNGEREPHPPFSSPGAS